MTQNAINNTASILAVDNLTLDGNTLSSTDTNGDIVLAPDGTGDVSVTTAPIVPSGDRADSLGSTTNSWDNVYCDGVSFDDGTTVLASYLEGTWTPVVAFGGASVGITYSSQIGTYTRIGRIVFWQFEFILTNKGSSTGAATITGLPFTSFATQQGPSSSFRYANLTYVVSREHVVGTVGAGSTSLQLLMDGDNVGGSNLTDALFANNSNMQGQGFYFV